MICFSRLLLGSFDSFCVAKILMMALCTKVETFKALERQDLVHKTGYGIYIVPMNGALAEFKDCGMPHAVAAWTLLLIKGALHGARHL